MEDISIEDSKKTQNQEDSDVDNLTREMSRTSISRRKVSFMGPLRLKYKHTPTASEKESRRIRRLLLLRIIDGHPYATIIESRENLKALNLDTDKLCLSVQDESGFIPLSYLANIRELTHEEDEDRGTLS